MSTSRALAWIVRTSRRRTIRALAALVVLLVAWRFVRRYALRPAPPAPDAATLEHARRSRIVRDKWGVPHVFGDRDQDAAFALAYAHAEDDYPTIQGSLAAARGQLGLVLLAKIAPANDYYAELVRVRQEVDATYAELPEDVRAVLEGYARGLNFYAFKHPSDVDTRLLPIRGRDVAAGFAHKLPFMLGLPKVIEALRSDAPPGLGQPVLGAPKPPTSGSNAHALSGARATDGVTRLNVNSHQPWEGPVAWYEAHITSKEGWNMTGGTFPGAPFILHGHSDALGWAHTVNEPDLVDVYLLKTDAAHPKQYEYDGKWLPLESTQARLEIDVGVANIVIHKEALWSVHGPVIEASGGRFYAMRYAGIGHRVRAAEQWFRMNKATSLETWRTAMRVGGIPMFNTAYADREHVFYVYNALLPVRTEGFDYTTVLPGDRSDVVFQSYLPFDSLPQVLDPPSGFVQTCNATPFAATSGAGNPLPASFSKTAGVETQQTNRARRSLALLSGDAKLSRDDFLRMKWDRAYAKDSVMFTDIVTPIATRFTPANDDERAAQELVRAWDGVTDEASKAAALAILTLKAQNPKARGAEDPKLPDVFDAFRDSVRFLKRAYGKVDVPLGDVQRLRHGAVDLPLGGGPDVMNAAYARREDGHLIGFQGDSLVVIVDFLPGHARSASVQPYGASNRPGSPHYSDQAPMFVSHQLKPTLRDPAELEKATERAYRPGE